MSTTRDELAEFLDNLLNPAAFADYGPNGLQIEGAEVIERVRAAADAEGLALDRQQWFAIWEASAGREVP